VPVSLIGNSGVVHEIDNNRARRLTLRPADVESLGSYRIANSSGTMSAGLAANATIYSCRWSETTKAMLLHSVLFQARTLGTAFTAGDINITLNIAREFLVSDSAQNGLILGGNQSKRRTSFGRSYILLGDLRISNTGAITAGTRTLDTFPSGRLRGFVPATQINYPWFDALTIPGASTVAGVMTAVPLFQQEPRGWPLVFVQSEGFVITATVPATGTWVFDVQMNWSEVTVNQGFN